MRINFHGQLVDEKEIKAGFIGCGSHSFRNIYPTLQYAPVNLVATCDLAIEKAKAFAEKFGAKRYYSDYHEMLEKEELDAVFAVTGYDNGRPTDSKIAIDCVNAGCHVWIEKPPAMFCADVDEMIKASKKTGKHIMSGLKKMFMPGNEKAKELMGTGDFGKVTYAMVQYPLWIPTEDDFAKFKKEKKLVGGMVGFLDHLCHPVSLMIFLFGMPKTLYYERSFSGSGVAVFSYSSGIVTTINFTGGASLNGGMERTVIVSDKGRHITVENNIRVSYHKNPPNEPGKGYGNSPNFFTGSTEETASFWEPEFSLGQLYNKGLFLLGYYSEVYEFARSILENRAPYKCHLEHMRQTTRIFEAFGEGAKKQIML